MRLHTEEELFKQAINVTSEYKKLPPFYIEKDYWVTYALKMIFENKGNEVVFKGGTALSKCYNMINRFSEDIDLVLIRQESDTDAQAKRKLKEFSKLVEHELPEIDDKHTNKKGMIRKTFHSFNLVNPGEYGHIRDNIVIEVTWLGIHEPSEKKQVSSFIYEMMNSNNQTDLIKEFELEPFDVQALDPKRTFCEKIMSLIRFSYADKPIDNLKFKVRHVYDLHKMLEVEDLSSFFNSAEFDQMLIKVAKDDNHTIKNNKDWLQYHPKEALIFKDTEGVWRQIKATYNGEFRDTIFGALPDESLVLENLKAIRNKIIKINWDIK